MNSYTVADAAEEATSLLDSGERMSTVWRHSIIQLLDAYESRLRNGGVAAAAALFDHEPPATRDQRVDAAFAALAEHLARRDDWPVPVWARHPSRTTDDWWFVTELRGMHPWSLREAASRSGRRRR